MPYLLKIQLQIQILVDPKSKNHAQKNKSTHETSSKQQNSISVFVLVFVERKGSVPVQAYSTGKMHIVDRAPILVLIYVILVFG